MLVLEPNRSQVEQIEKTAPRRRQDNNRSAENRSLPGRTAVMSSLKKCTIETALSRLDSVDITPNVYKRGLFYSRKMRASIIAFISY